VKPLTVGLSTCPNDTFAFHHLMERVERGDHEPVAWVLDDVQALNERLARGELDIGKLSCGAALRLSEEIDLLPVGAALGFGVGPVVLTGLETLPPLASARVLTPGRDTTAHLLWELFTPGAAPARTAVFHAILPALERREADLGVCIHEARFTYRARGLRLVRDLGHEWEATSGLPLPLGAIGVRRDLVAREPTRVAAFARALRESIALGLSNPAACLPTMRRHAQEFDDAVLLEHVHTYVNDATLDLGAEGRAALHLLWSRACDVGFCTTPRSPRVLDLS